MGRVEEVCGNNRLFIYCLIKLSFCNRCILFYDFSSMRDFALPTTAFQFTGHPKLNLLDSDAVTLVIKSLWSGHGMFGSTLDQVTACGLITPSHFLIQFWLTIMKIFGPHFNSYLSRSCYQPQNIFENDIVNICVTFPRDQWVKLGLLYSRQSVVHMGIMWMLHHKPIDILDTISSLMSGTVW